MTFFHAIILSIIEGITEFLPVSSTGHLILTAHLLGLSQTDFIKTFEVIIQLGAILAVVVLYGKTLATNKKIFIRVALAFIPTALLGYMLYPFIKDVLFENQLVIVSALCIGGLALLLFEHFYKETNKSDSIENLGVISAVAIGLAQSLSFVPGVSRAAATILGGLAVGLPRAQAVEFSFLLAIPTMLAASGLDLLKSGVSFSQEELSLLLTGMLGSFITAYVVIRWFIRFIQRHTFSPFGIYRILIAIVYFMLVLR